MILFDDAGGDFRLGEVGDFFGEVVEGIAAEGHVHAFVGAEGVDRQRHVGAAHGLEEEPLIYRCRAMPWVLRTEGAPDPVIPPAAARIIAVAVRRFGYAICDLRNFQHGIDRRG